MAAAVRDLAHAHGWIVIAPTLAYGNWQDPVQVAAEAARLEPQLARLVDAVPAETGVVLAERLLVFGFSRGAQAALRFTMLYPERVQAVAALSAGTYTLPLRTVNTVAGPVAAPFPFGIADVEQRTGRSVDLERMARARFWIGVGGADTNESEVPRQWDPSLGRHRVERAQRFAAALGQLGCDVQFTVVPGAGHRLTPPMLEQAGRFLASAAAEAQP